MITSKVFLFKVRGAIFHIKKALPIIHGWSAEKKVSMREMELLEKKQQIRLAIITLDRIYSLSETRTKIYKKLQGSVDSKVFPSRRSLNSTSCIFLQMANIVPAVGGFFALHRSAGGLAQRITKEMSNEQATAHKKNSQEKPTKKSELCFA